MKLSEAICEGAKLRPQAFDHMFNKIDVRTWGSCALGAALEAAFDVGPGECINGDNDLQTLAAVTGADLNMTCDDPAEHRQTTIHTAILRLNDVHHWTREAIADWLGTLGY